MRRRWWAGGAGLVCGALPVVVVISVAPHRPVFWVVGLLYGLVHVAIGVALARGWRPRRARPLLGMPSVWDNGRDRPR